MALDLLQHCLFTGPALPEPYVQFDLEKELAKKKLLPKTTGSDGKALQASWESYRRKLRELVVRGGGLRVRNHVLEPLVPRLGYEMLETASDVQTREGLEPGGYLMQTADGASKLRVWATDFEADLDAPAKRGAAFRYSHLRMAQRVLLTSGERVGLLTNGVELRILISDPARPDSQISIPVDTHWKRCRNVPDSYLLLLALASPSGVKELPDIVDKARLQQARVTKELRVQARQAVRLFIQSVLEHPENREKLPDIRAQETGAREQGTVGKSDFQPSIPDLRSFSPDTLAKQLWREGLIIVYRLLFVLKLESSDDPARAFSFASTSLWRNSFSPTMALADYARQVISDGIETGHLLEGGLKAMFRMFAEGLECTELNVKPLGGALFGVDATPVLSQLAWGERAVAHLLDQLLWTAQKRGSQARQRVHYGPLDVEDLGRVYEALLELEPGIAAEPMCRLRRQKLEVVVPMAQGDKYRPAGLWNAVATELDEGDDEEEEDETPKRSKKTKVEWIEEIQPGQFYLRVGLGRKSSGSYYTPHSFVRFLVQETLGPQVEERSPKEDPNPLEILKLKVLDPAMGSGHFLVEACRFLGDKLYEACRLCDERASAAEARVEKAKSTEANVAALAEAQEYWRRVIDLPDPDDKLMKYLPSSAPEGQESGLSQQEALALCRRLVAVHCLYGVDKNPLAVELAKLSLWLESHAEGLPLTFLDHRLVLGDSLTGPFFEHLLKEPASGDDVQKLVWQNVNEQFRSALEKALTYVKALEASIGINVSDIESKRISKQKLDQALAPFKILAAAWSGGVMLGDASGDTDYANLFSTIAETGDLPEDLSNQTRLLAMISKGLGVESVPGKRSELLAKLELGNCVPAFPYDASFAEVFYPKGDLTRRNGFDVILGNPPWNKTNLEMPDFMGGFDLRFLEADGSKREELAEEYQDSLEWKAWLQASAEEDQIDMVISVLHPDAQSESSGFGSGHSDIFAPFVDCCERWLKPNGSFGLVLPTALHVSHSLNRLRKKLLSKLTLKLYFSYENKKSLFEIDKRWKFSLVVATNSIPLENHSFPAQFYLCDEQWLFSDSPEPKAFLYSSNFIRKMDPENLVFQEFSSTEDAICAETVFLNSIEWQRFSEENGWQIRRELNASEDRWRFGPEKEVGRSWNSDHLLIINHLPGTIHHFTDLWRGAEAATIPVKNLIDRPRVLELTRYYRAVYRITARATDERTSIYAILCPGTTATNKLPIEGSPSNRPNSLSLGAVAVCNSYVFDWCLRLRVGSKDVSKFIMNVTPMNEEAAKSTICAHQALRLTTNHSGYEPLWREQLGNEWREPGKPPFTWPVLATDDERWAVRAAIDAVVAQAYGLTRNQYAHVLSTFSHKSYPNAPHLCLAAFDELTAIGLDAFTRKHDPYHDIPLNESLPKPVIDLPLPATTTEPQQGSLDLGALS